MKNKITLVISMILGLFVFNACNEPYPESIELEQFMYISLSGATDNPIIKTVDLDKTSSFPLSVSYGGTTNYEQGDIVANIAADILLVDLSNPSFHPFALPVRELIYNTKTSDISEVIINGKLLKQGGKVLVADKKDIVMRSEKAMEKVWQRARDIGVL